MKRLFFAILLIILWFVPANAQDFNQSYNFINTGTSAASNSFANTGVNSFLLSWSPQVSLFTCAVQVDSSADGITWGSGDLIPSQNCISVGSSSILPLATGKNFVRVHVTVLTGNGGLNITLKGWGGGGVASQFSVKTFGAVGDAKASVAVTLTQSSATITDTTNSPWLSTDVGKKIACTYGPSNIAAINNASGISTIATFNSASSITMADQIIGGIGTIGTEYCVWFTKDDTSAFCCGTGSAFTAAHASVSGTLIASANRLLGTPTSAVTCSGGFAVSGPIINQTESTSGTQGVSIIGQGCYIYLLPNASMPAGTGLINYVNASLFKIQGLDITGGGITYSWPANTGLVNLSTAGQFLIYDNRIISWGGSSGNSALVNIVSPSGPAKVEKNHISVSIGSASPGLFCSGCNGTPTFDTNYIGNNSVAGNMILQNSGARNTTVSALNFIAHQGDECGTAQGSALINGCVQLQNAVLIFKGGYLFGPGASISVDGTSEADLYGVNVGGFTSTGNFPAVVLGSGAKIFATNTTFRGNGTGTAFSQVSGTSTVNDLGGNVMQNCSNTVCTAASIAQTSNAGVNFVFPLTPTATTQLGGSQTVSGSVPTGCSITGNGTSTCAFDTGSTNAAGRITITAAGTTTAVGLVSFSFTGTYGTNSTSCSANYLSGSGAWSITAIAPIFITNTTAGASFNINNAGTNLSAASTYKVNYTCYGQ